MDLSLIAKRYAAPDSIVQVRETSLHAGIAKVSLPTQSILFVVFSMGDFIVVKPCPSYT